MTEGFWSIAHEDGVEVICSKHRSHTVALREASRCERRGGNDHRIVYVVEVVPYGRKKRAKKKVTE